MDSTKCTCPDPGRGRYMGCPIHGGLTRKPRQDRLGLLVPEGTMVTLPGEAPQEVVRDGPDGMLMLHPAGPLGDKAANVVRRMLTRWLQRPELRAVVLEVVKEDVRQRGPVVVNEAARTIAAHLPPVDLNRALYGEPLIVRATPEQSAALAEARDPQAEINARGNRMMEWLSQGEVGWVPQRPEPAAVIGTIRTPPAPGLYRAPSAPMICRHCGWVGREFELIAHPTPAPPGVTACPACKTGGGLTARYGQQTPAAPVAACTAHVTAAPKTPEVHCAECSWEGAWSEVPYRNPQNAESPACPGCGAHAGPDGCMEEGPASVETTPSPLDQAIRGSASLDPGGDRKPAEHLLVETFDQAEARRKVDAERIANMGRQL